MAYLIYIAKDDTDMLEKGKSESMWGLSQQDVENHQFQPGDLLLFTYKIRADPMSDGSPPEGFPLLDDYNDVDIEFEKIMRAEVKSKPSKNPDVFGENFPFVIDISYKDTEEKRKNIKEEVKEAVRLSVINNSIQPLDDFHFFDYTESGGTASDFL